MAQVIIENPVLNSPFEEPCRHFRFDDEGITNVVVPERRTSSYFIPIARPKKRGRDALFDTGWTKDRIEENKVVDRIRQRVKLWREGHYVGVTTVTRQLLTYWTNPEREKKLFFCQIEAAETAIYIAEVARRYGDAWIENDLRSANDSANPGLPRMAVKLATGAGKTVVMAMLIAWQALNKLAKPQDARFSDTFLIVTPGITIRDRLRVLLPNDPDNYYRQRDVLNAESLNELKRARILVTNYHAFLPREKIKAPKTTKALAGVEQTGAAKESPDEMVRRVCRGLGNKRNIIVINDEAHHCYRRKPGSGDEKLDREEKQDADNRNKKAFIWLSGLEAVKRKLGVRTIFDLSATPFFLRGSGYDEGTLFPWVVSDFSLIDAIEAGIVKVPRVPVADDSMTGDGPTYRDLWLRIRDDLPRKGRSTAAVEGEPKLPVELQGALHSLYGNYEKAYRRWEENTEARARGLTPPVFIVVCANTNVSKLVYDYIAGWEKTVGDRTIVQAGALPIFRNDDDRGGWLHRPNTILVDSEQLESGDAMSADFKKIAAREIDDFKTEYQARFPGRDADNLKDEDLLREVMNTVGKAGKLGEHVKCVVSVSMLTEGWDANTVTHILGVRAFGTQLLCEQVVGRGLRRMSYAPETLKISHQHHTAEFVGFPPEYAEVYGVPFSFIPCSGSSKDSKPGPQPTRVRALENRIACEITFPRVVGYRYEVSSERLSYTFTADSQLALSTADIPTRVENAPIVGQRTIHTLDDLKRHREQEVVFKLAKLVLERYFRDDCTPRTDRPAEHCYVGDVQAWLFPQVLRITRDWFAQCLTCKHRAFPQLLLLLEFAYDAADRIYKAIVGAEPGVTTLRPILRPYDTLGSTRYVDFDTTRPVYATRADRCHVSHVVADTESWEQKMADVLEGDDVPVIHYVKNHNLGFTIPYTINGEEKNYIPDFLCHVDDGRGPADPLNLIIEVSGEPRKDKAAKVSTARTLWVPAVNNHGGFGRWAFVEIADPWDAARHLLAVARTG
jgi:type III restriction enzyme